MFVAYLRVSTQRQGTSGLGLEAQREAVLGYAARTGTPIIEMFTEVESGAVKVRPQLQAALEACRQRRAVLLVAKLDRLGRNVATIAQLLDANIDIRVADMPEASRLLLQMLAVFAEHERRMISERTKSALAAAKARGVRLGLNGTVLARQHQADASNFARLLSAEIDGCRARGAVTLTAMAADLNARRIQSREGGRWHPASVARVVRRLRELNKSNGEDRSNPEHHRR